MNHFSIDLTYARDTLQLEHLALDRVDGRIFKSEVIIILREILSLKQKKNKALKTDLLKSSLKK